MKILTAILLSVACLSLQSNAQNKGDSKIIITLADTTDIYEKVRVALVKADFVVKDLNNPDFLETYPRDLRTMSGVAVAYATITGSQVTLTGQYSLKKVTYFGTSKSGKDIKRITHYKGSKLWPLLMKVANQIGDNIAYQQ